MKSASIAYAKLDSEEAIKIRAKGRKVPIIVVPGFMGTRLSDPVTKRLVWNPTGFPMSLLAGATPGTFACDFERLQQTAAELVPDDWHLLEDEKERKAVEHIKYWHHLSTPHYGLLARQLAEKSYLLSTDETEKLGLEPKVYCCGYDWRQDNARSALRLAQVVDEALRETGEDKCILVIHSMGGLVARHYCRALGGESKVFAVFSVGSPMLGAPSAYTQLKHGAPGAYVREYFKQELEEDPDLAVFDNAMSSASQVLAIPAMAKSGNAKDGVIGVLGPVYLVLVLGAGRLLTRKETTVFARQLPAAFQLLPSALFCESKPSWAVFDPLNTGHPASGYLIKFPVLLDALTLGRGQPNALADAAAQAEQELSDKINKFLHGDPSLRTNALLEGANSETIEECIAGIGALLGSLGGDAELDDPTVSRAIARVLGLIDRATKSFLDARNNKVLYGDIFTGFLDMVSMRAVSAYHLELAYRFDDSITVNPREVPHLSALDLVIGIIKGAFAMLASLRKEMDPEKLAAKAKKAAKAALEAERARPRAYVHPRTIAYATTNVPVDGGSLVACLDVKSNHDYNLAKFQMLMNPLGAAMTPPTKSSDRAAVFYGDGTVPYFSARPPDELLSSPLLKQSTDFKKFMHVAMTAEPFVIGKIKQHIVELLPEWYSA